MTCPVFSLLGWSPWIWKYCQSTTNAQTETLQNLKVLLQVSPLVTSALICALLIGPILLSAFLVVQIGQEGRAAVVHFREALPVWSMDNATDASNGTLGGPGFVRDFLNQEWVRDYRVQVRCSMLIALRPMCGIFTFTAAVCMHESGSIG